MGSGPSRGALLRAFACVYLTLHLCGCGDTGIVINLDGRLSIPEDLNAIEARVTVGGIGGSPDAVFETERILLAAGDTFPFFFALVPGDVPLGRVTVNVTAFRVEPGGPDAPAVLVASGSTESVFEAGKVHREIVMLARAGCGDDPFETLDDGPLGASINADADGAQSGLALCTGDASDRFNFVVPPDNLLRVIFSQFQSTDPLAGVLEARVSCTNLGESTAVLIAQGPISFGEFLRVEPSAVPRTCVMDLTRPPGAPPVTVRYGFVATLFAAGIIPSVCSDDGLEGAEPVSVDATAPGTATGPPDMVLCPENRDRYVLTLPASRLVAVDLDAGAVGALVSGRLQCADVPTPGGASGFPLLARTRDASGGGPTTLCDLDMLGLASIGVDYEVRVTPAELGDCLADAFGANHTPPVAADVSDRVGGGPIGPLAVCAGQPDYFRFTYEGTAQTLQITTAARWLSDGDVNLCVYPSVVGVDAATAPLENCSWSAGDVEAVSVPVLAGGTYLVEVSCLGAPCGNAYSLEIAEGIL
jgi:hypothetical protein